MNKIAMKLVINARIFFLCLLVTPLFIIAGTVPPTPPVIKHPMPELAQKNNKKRIVKTYGRKTTNPQKEVVKSQVANGKELMKDLGGLSESLKKLNESLRTISEVQKMEPVTKEKEVMVTPPKKEEPEPEVVQPKPMVKPETEIVKKEEEVAQPPILEVPVIKEPILEEKEEIQEPIEKEPEEEFIGLRPVTGTIGYVGDFEYDQEEPEVSPTEAIEEDEELEVTEETIEKETKEEKAVTAAIEGAVPTLEGEAVPEEVEGDEQEGIKEKELAVEKMMKEMEEKVVVEELEEQEEKEAEKEIQEEITEEPTEEKIKEEEAEKEVAEAKKIEEKKVAAEPMPPVEPAEPEVPEEKVLPPVSEIDTIDIEEGGNWLLKRKALEDTIDLIEQINAVFTKILEASTNYKIQRNKIDNEFDLFASNIGFNLGELDQVLTSLMEDLQKEREEQDDLTVEEREIVATINEKKNIVEQLQKDVQALESLDNEIDNVVKTVDDQIKVANNYQNQAWRNFQTIKKILSDEKAEELYYRTESFFKSMQDIHRYFTSNLASYFTDQLQTMRNQMDKVKNEIQELQEKGIDLKQRFAKLEEEDEERERQREKEEQEEAIRKALKQAEQQRKATGIVSTIKYIVMLPFTIIGGTWNFITGLFTRAPQKVETPAVPFESAIGKELVAEQS
ncbi:MAG: hypothetical protein WDZ41_06025 [Candidatus Babeliales bacterium]